MGMYIIIYFLIFLFITHPPGAGCFGICLGLARDNPNQDNPKTFLIYRDYWVALGFCKHILADIKLSNISTNILILSLFYPIFLS